MANLELNAYIQTLAKLQGAIDTTVGSIRMLESQMNSSWGATGSFLLPLQNQADQLKIRFETLLAAKNQLLSSPPNGGYRPNWVPYSDKPDLRATGTSIVPYSNPLANERQREILSRYINIQREAVNSEQRSILEAEIARRQYASAMNNSTLALKQQRIEEAAGYVPNWVYAKGKPSNPQQEQIDIFTKEIASRRKSLEFTNATNLMNVREKINLNTGYKVSTDADFLAGKITHDQWKISVDAYNQRLEALLSTEKELVATQKILRNTPPVPTNQGGLANAPLTSGQRHDLGRIGKGPVINDALGYSQTQAYQSQINDVFDQALIDNKFFDAWTNDPRYSTSRKYAEGVGFKGAPNVTTVGTSGVQQLDWKQASDIGINEKLRLFNTPAGGNLESTSRQYQTLTSAIGRDIRELTKWSIAIALIYGPLNALKSLTADMIENQTRLADAMIAMTGASLRVGEVFDLVRQSADAMGTGVGDTINSFTQAYRATGSLGTVNERITTSTVLLKDSMILAKLSGMEEAVAIDTLAASLRQTNSPLDEGASLLDKWVRTTQVANVDLLALSTGFAVLGDAAETAGMSVDELNGLLAAIAETGISSGKEVANTAKAIVSGFYSDKATLQLNNLGIATKDAEGNLRDFNRIATEIYQQRQLGLITDTAFQTTARDIGGGGNRRQAQVTTLLENYSRVQQVAAESALANGEAQAAMGRRLDTVQTSTTRLNNAFQSLVMSLGNEGGILTLFTDILGIATTLTNVFDQLIASIGKAGPMLMTIGAGSLLLRSQGPTVGTAIGGGLDRMLATLIGVRYANTYEPSANVGWIAGQSPQGTYAGSRAVNSLFSSTPNRFNIGAGLLAGLAPAVANLRNQNEDPFATQKAAGNAAGVLGGYFAASIMSFSPIIGMVIGSAIGEGIITTATKKGNMSALLFVLSEYGRDQGYTNTAKSQYTPDAGTDALFKTAGFGSAWVGKLMLGIPGLVASLVGGTSEEMAYNLTEDMAKAGNHSAQRYMDEFNKARDLLILQNPDIYKVPATSMDTAQKNQMDTYGTTLTQMRKDAEALLLEQLQVGDVTPAEYTRKRGTLSTYEERATKYMSTFGKPLMDYSPTINSEMDAYQAFLNLIVNGTPEALESITSMSTEIYDLKNKLEGLANPKYAGTDLLTMDNESQTVGYFIEKYKARIAELESMLPGIVDTGNRAAQAGLVRSPTVVNEAQAYSTADYNLISKTYREQEFARLRQLNPTTGPEAISNDQINAYLDSQDKFGVYVEDFGTFIYMLTGGIGGAGSDAFSRTANDLREKGLITTGTSKTEQNLQTLDIYSSQFPLLQMYTDQARAALKSVPGYVEPASEALKVFGKDWIGGVIHGDQIALRLALEKLIGIEEKQLEGIYNLPDGSFFTAFLTPEWMALMPKGSGGASGGYVGSSEITTTTPTTAIPVPGALPEDPDAWLEYSGFELKTPKASKLPSTGRFRGANKLGAWEKSLKQPSMQYDLPYSPEDAEIINNPKMPMIIPLLLKTMGFTGLSGMSWGASVGGAPAASKVNLNLNTTTNVHLDGRLIASIIKTYLSEDLLRTTAGYGKTTKDFIV